VNYIITKGKIEDYQDIIDFGNYVFNVDFPTLLPKLYTNHEETAVHHHMVKEGHKIKAIVGSFPLVLRVGSHDLKARGIGTVSVHRYSRGSGYMKLLMDNAVKEMIEDGCDLAVLGGQRQRYEYWGFTPCGIDVKMNFNSSNIKHVKVGAMDNYRFVKYNESYANDLDKAIKLHDSQIVHAVREKDKFIEIVSSWNNNLYFIFNNDEFAGYICSASNGDKISEIILVEPRDIDKVIIAYMKQFDLKNTSVDMYLHRPEEFMKLRAFCENFSISSSCNIYIINYLKVIKAFMELKNTVSPLSEGLLVLRVEEKGNFKIEVKEGFVTVEETDKPHDIALPQLEASALLFSHSSFISTAFNVTNPLAKEWFPLPLFYPKLDNV
jgi:predicted GNAT family N-acyltransferase